MASSGQNRFAPPKCRICGAPLTPLQARQSPHLCERLECRGPYLQELKRKALEESKRRRLSLAEKALRGTRYQATQLPVVVVPSNDERLVDLSAGRRKQFAQTLQKSIAAAENDLSKAAERSATQAAEGIRPTVSAFVENACGTCRGACCRNGGTHAFLDRESILRIWKQQPELTAEGLQEIYLGALPEQTYEGSCVFHTEQGCALNREMRGDVCNEFLCEAFLDHPDELQAKPGSASIAIAVDPGGNAKRIAVVGDPAAKPLSAIE